jgi:hypothetical protein
MLKFVATPSGRRGLEGGMKENEREKGSGAGLGADWQGGDGDGGQRR